jgi:gas vesicle protein
MEIRMRNWPLNIIFLLGGIVIGSLLSTIATLMLAPQSGRETRRIIRHRGQELRDRALDTVDDTRDRIYGTVDDARYQAEELAHMASERASTSAQRAREGTRERMMHLRQAVVRRDSGSLR